MCVCVSGKSFKTIEYIEMVVVGTLKHYKSVSQVSGAIHFLLPQFYGEVRIG